MFAGYGLAFNMKGQIVFRVDRMNLLVQVPVLDKSPQMELGQILKPLGYWCNLELPELYNKQLYTMISPMVQQVMSKTYCQAFHMKREVEVI